MSDLTTSLNRSLKPSLYSVVGIEKAYTRNGRIEEASEQAPRTSRQTTTGNRRSLLFPFDSRETAGKKRKEKNLTIFGLNLVFH